MLFLVTQEHTPDNCPARDDLPPDVLFGSAGDVKVRFAVADVPGHRLTFLLEADTYDQLKTFLEPGRTRATTTIAPVTELSVGG
jgi:hypothetical protein